MKAYKVGFMDLNKALEWILEDDPLEVKVRWSIFTIIGVCAGLPALVWSVRDLIHHRKNGHRISVFVILLLLTDFVELLLSPCILVKHLLDGIVYLDGTLQVLWALFWASRDCGILLNQMVALEGILSVKYPLYTACVFSSPCFIIFYILVFLCIFIGHIILDPVYRIFIAVLVLIVSVITWIISCGASCSANRHSHTFRTPDHHVAAVFIFTLLVLYLPYILLRLLLFLPRFVLRLPLWFIPYFLMSVRLISDPLLCVLVCRQNLRIQTSQNPETSEIEIENVHIK